LALAHLMVDGFQGGCRGLPRGAGIRLTVRCGGANVFAAELQNSPRLRRDQEAR